MNERDLAYARYLGADAALVAATTLILDEDEARALANGTAEVPDPPNLSGEWADDPTPASLVHDVFGYGPEAFSDDRRADIVDALAEAWEEGRDHVWTSAVLATALRTLGLTEIARWVESVNEHFVDTQRDQAGDR